MIAGPPPSPPLRSYPGLALRQRRDTIAAMRQEDPPIDIILEQIRARMAGEPEPDVVNAPAVKAPQPAPVAPPPAGAITLEALVRSLLEPQLQRWLDANLPEMVERLAQAEIRRLTGQS